MVRQYQGSLVNIIGVNQTQSASQPLQPSQFQVPAQPQIRQTTIPEQAQIPDRTEQDYQQILEETEHQYQVVKKALEVQSVIRQNAVLSRGAPERQGELAGIFDAIANAGLNYLDMERKRAEELAVEQQEALKIEQENRALMGRAALEEIVTDARDRIRQYGDSQGIYTTREDINRVLEMYQDLPAPMQEELWKFAYGELRELENSHSTRYFEAARETQQATAALTEAQLTSALSGELAALSSAYLAPEDVRNTLARIDNYLITNTQHLDTASRLRVMANAITGVAQAQGVGARAQRELLQRQADLQWFIPFIETQIRPQFGNNPALFKEQILLYAPESIRSLVSDIPNNAQLLSSLAGQYQDVDSIQGIFRDNFYRQQREQGAQPQVVSLATDLAYKIFNRTDSNALAEYSRIQSIPEGERLPHENLTLTIVDSWRSDQEEYSTLNNQLQELFQDQAGEILRLAEGESPETVNYVDPRTGEAWRLIVRDSRTETDVYVRDSVTPAQEEAMKARIDSVSEQIVQTRAQIQNVLRRAATSGLDLTNPLSRNYIDLINQNAQQLQQQQFGSGQSYDVPLPGQPLPNQGTASPPSPQGTQSGGIPLSGAVNQNIGFPGLVNSPAQSGLPQIPVTPQQFLQGNQPWTSNLGNAFSGFNWGISEPPPGVPSGIPPMYPYARTQVNGVNIPIPFPTETARSVIGSNPLRITRSQAASGNYREGRREPLSRVVLHETVGTADSAIQWMQNPQSQVSYHYIIRRNGEVVNLVHPGDTAFGAYGANDGSLHISLETPDDGRGNQPTHSGYTPEQYTSLSRLLDQNNLWEYEITTHEHVDTTGERIDPRSFRQDLFQQARQASTNRVVTTVPLNVSTTSGYGNRVHPVHGNQAFHAGIDFGSQTFYDGDVGAIAMTGGYVVDVQDWNGYGGTVLVQTPEGYIEQYSHLRSFLVQPGQQIQPGTPIGVIGGDRSDPMPGTSTGRHLHFQVWNPGTNPLQGNPQSDTLDPVTYLQQIGVTEYPGRGVGQGSTAQGSYYSYATPDTLPTQNGNWLGTLNREAYPYLTSFVESLGSDVLRRALIPAEQVYQTTQPFPSIQAPSNAQSYNTGNSGQNDPTANYGYDIIAQDREFAAAIADVANQLGIPGQWLADLMAHESAHTFDTGISGIETAWGRGIGLIQAMTRGVLQDWGYTEEQVAAMSRAEYMYKITLRYLQPIAHRLNSMRDLATAVYRGIGSLDWDDSQELLDYIDRLGETVGRRYRANNLQSALQHSHDTYQENCPICQQQLNRFGAIIPHNVG